MPKQFNNWAIIRSALYLPRKLVEFFPMRRYDQYFLGTTTLALALQCHTTRVQVQCHCIRAHAVAARRLKRHTQHIFPGKSSLHGAPDRLHPTLVMVTRKNLCPTCRRQGSKTTCHSSVIQLLHTRDTVLTNFPLLLRQLVCPIGL